MNNRSWNHCGCGWKYNRSTQTFYTDVPHRRSIHPSSTAYSFSGSQERVGGRTGANSTYQQERAGYSLDSSSGHRRVTYRDKQLFMITFVSTVRATYSTMKDVFEQWEEVGISGEKPCPRGKKMQSPHRENIQEWKPVIFFF